MTEGAQLEQPPVKPDCHKCKHRRRSMLGAHSACAHPSSGLNQDDGLGGLMGVAQMMIGAVSPDGIRALGITCRAHGLRNGWFSWPADFDPVWLVTCNGFEPKEGVNVQQQAHVG